MLHFPTRQQVLVSLQFCSSCGGYSEMSQLCFALLIAVGLTLTAYFGVAAWRVSENSDVGISAEVPLTAR